MRVWDRRMQHLPSSSSLVVPCLSGFATWHQSPVLLTAVEYKHVIVLSGDLWCKLFSVYCWSVFVNLPCTYIIYARRTAHIKFFDRDVLLLIVNFFHNILLLPQILLSSALQPPCLRQECPPSGMHTSPFWHGKRLQMGCIWKEWHVSLIAAIKFM